MRKLAPYVALAALFQPSYAMAQSPTMSLTPEQRDQEIQAIHQDLKALEVRLAALEGAPVDTSATTKPLSDAVAKLTQPAPPPAERAGTLSTQDQATLGFFGGTTINFLVDGYYGYNLNQPIGRVNLLRALTVTSNTFTIDQALLVVEKLPTSQDHVGGRLDLMFGQATETLQGSSLNEQRPQVWRNIYQAYGSYLAPVGSGLEIDFGKWASSLGNEGVYTKDQIAYSRSFAFNYLPFYHMGMRANYNVTPKLNVAYWLVNGANDTEDLNSFKSQNFAFVLKPASGVTWTTNYYFGEEARDVEPTVNQGMPTGPAQPGLPTANIVPQPNGREHIFDTYATWQATPRLLLVGESDYVINRNYAEQSPGHTALGLFSFKYSLGRGWAAGGRAEYADDRSGLFSGTSQALKEGTLVLDRVVGNNFLMRGEYRRDSSNRAFFLTNMPGVLVHVQPTLTMGLVYWWGTKQGAW